MSPRLRELRCGHLFHSECIDVWLQRQRLCPLCKGNVQQSADSDSSFSLEAGGSRDVELDMPENVPGTPERSTGDEATLDVADPGDEEEGRSESGEMRTPNQAPTNSPQSTDGALGRIPPPLPICPTQGAEP